MSLGQVLKLVAFPLAIAAGQLLFKQVAAAIPRGAGLSALQVIALDPRMWMAIILYGSATILWVHILSTMPLSRAYPVTALAFVIVPVVGVLFFGERVDIRYVVGVLLIIVGVVLTATSRIDSPAGGDTQQRGTEENRSHRQ
jgi:drug/metabolite transporter (DMT)-like permease